MTDPHALAVVGVAAGLLTLYTLTRLAPEITPVKIISPGHTITVGASTWMVLRVMPGDTVRVRYARGRLRCVLQMSVATWRHWWERHAAGGLPTEPELGGES